MSGRPERLQRLLAIRRLNEDLGRRGLQLALASVAEVDAALATQKMAQLEFNLAARAALNAGDRGEWLLADAQIEVAGWNRERLNTMLHARAGEVPPAMAKFLETRLEHEQVKQLVEDGRRASQTEEDRRTQAAADDWFLSKRMRPDE